MDHTHSPNSTSSATQNNALQQGVTDVSSIIPQQLPRSDLDRTSHHSQDHPSITTADTTADRPSQASLVHSSQQSASHALVHTPSRRNELVSPWSESLHAVLEQPPANFPRIILLTGVVFSGIFLAWSYFSQIQEVSYAQGELTSEGGTYKVQAIVPGEVDQILVDEGEAVHEGQVLGRLDSHIEEVEIQRLKESIAAYQLQLLQTRSLISQTQAEAQVRRAIATSEIQAQQAGMVEAETNMITTQSLLDQIHGERVAHEERLARIRPLVEEGAIAEDALFDVEQSLRERQQSITRHEGEVEKNQADLVRAEALLNERQAESEQRELELQQRLQALERDASELEAKIVEAQNLLKAAQTRLEQMVFYAPNDGFVLDVSIQRVGEMMQPGQTLIEIAPTESPLVLSAVIPSRDAGLVETGMEAQVKLDAFPYQEYGIISGTVSTIAPDTETNEEMGAVYRLEIALDQDYVMHENQETDLKPGQTATAEVVIRKRRIIDLLLDPIRKLKTSNINL